MLGYYVAFLNTVGEDVTAGSDREKLVLSMVLKSFQHTVLINGAIEFLLPDLKALRTALGLSQDGVPFGAITNVRDDRKSNTQ